MSRLTGGDTYFSHSKAVAMEGGPEISVIIPALNEEKYLGRTLDGLRRQSFKNFETIVVDGGSRDSTRRIAGRYAKVIIERRPGIGRGRNAGAARARGSILVFIDADTKPSPSLLKEYHLALGSGNAVAATGPILPLEKSSRRINLGFKLVSVFMVRVSILIGRPSIVGSNFAVRKDVFDRLGGFKNSLITYEDWELSHRLKKSGRVLYVPNALAYTSARRVLAWGTFHYFAYHLKNAALYNLFKKARKDYAPVR